MAELMPLLLFLLRLAQQLGLLTVLLFQVHQRSGELANLLPRFGGFCSIDQIDGM